MAGACSRWRVVAGAAAALTIAGAAVLAMAEPPRPAKKRPPTPASTSAAGIAVAVLSWSDRPVERAALEVKDTWRRLGEGDRVRTGDSLRTSPDGLACLDFPWMRVTLGPSSVLSVPASVVLSTVLERGRAEFSGQGRDIVKIRVGQSEIRGGGRLVLRRDRGLAAASAFEGAFRVTAAGTTVEIKAGQGTTFRDGAVPEPAGPLPAAPRGLLPGPDPLYVAAGRPVELHWTPAGTAYHVEVLGMQGDDVLLARDASRSPLRLEIPWLGTYRWRVSVLDARGVESQPSSDGYVCVVEK
jgi:hypothetical protein